MDFETTAVLIAERDSQWRGWAARLGAGGPVRVLAQGEAETTMAFALRVRAELETAGAVDTAVLAGGTTHDAEALAARALLVQSIAAHMPVEAGHILLDGGISDRGRFAMEALASVVADQLHGIHVVTAERRSARPLAA